MRRIYWRFYFLALMVATALAAAQSAADQFREAMSLAGAGKIAEAEQILRVLEAAHPKEFEIRYRLGLVLLRAGKAKEAVSQLESATALQPGSGLAWISLARARLSVGAREKALEAAAEAARFTGTGPPILRALAIFYAEALEFGRAAEFEERWGRAAPEDGESRLRAAAYFAREGDVQREKKAVAKAVEAYQNAIRVAPGEQQAYYKLATLFLDHRTPQPAVSILTAAASKFEKEAEYQRLLGLAWYQIGETQKAIDAFLLASDLAPESDVGYASLETLLGDAGPRLPEIITRLRRFQERRPESPVGHFLLGRARQLDGASPAEVEGLFEKAVEVNSQFWPAYYELGQLLGSSGRIDDALKALLRSVALNRAYAPAHYALARLYAAKGDRTRAVAHRKTHHELARAEEEATQRARAAAPALLYRVEPSRMEPRKP